jgi:hypothetical protein
MGLFPQKNVFVFCIYLIRFEKETTLLKNFFQLKPFFFEKTQFENSTKTVIPFYKPFYVFDRFKLRDVYFPL